MKIIGPRPMMLATRRFGGDVFSGLAGVWSAYTAILMSTSSWAPPMLLAELCLMLTLLVPPAAMGFSDYTSMTLAVINSEDVSGDMAKIAGILRSLGFVEAEVSRYAPPEAIGFRAYPGQFTVIAPEKNKHRITVSFGEASKSLSSRGKATYAGLRGALQAEFSNSRVVGPKESSSEEGPNPAVQGTLRDKAVIGVIGDTA